MARWRLCSSYLRRSKRNKACLIFYASATIQPSFPELWWFGLPAHTTRHAGRFSCHQTKVGRCRIPASSGLLGYNSPRTDSNRFWYNMGSILLWPANALNATGCYWAHRGSCSQQARSLFLRSIWTFWLSEYNNFHNIKPDKWQKWVDKLDEAAQKSSLLLVRDFFVRYSDKHLPLWLACELMDFGSSVFFFSSVEQQIQKKVSRSLGLPTPTLLTSWLRALNDVRNACAHHNRVWNRGWVKQPAIPAKDANWYYSFDQQSEQWIQDNSKTVAFNMSKTGGILTVCHYLLRLIASNSQWRERLFALIAEPRFANIPHTWMGLPANWQEHPLWK